MSADRYPADAGSWLEQWDSGNPVWSVEMGGIGPGYEQAIQVTTAEVVRWLVREKPDHSKWSDPDVWAKDRERLEAFAFSHPVIEKLGLSGAQWGAAVNLATIMYRRGPNDAFSDEAVKDRLILVSKPSPAFAA